MHDKILAAIKGLKKVIKQLAEVDKDVDSHRKTEMKDPNSEDGDTEKY